MSEVEENPKQEKPVPTRRLTPARMLFAMLVGEGKSQYEAAVTAYPKWRQWTKEAVYVEASRLAKDPRVANLIELHAVGAHNLGRANLPIAVETTAQILTKSEAKDADRLKAADSLQDRFGAPRNAQIALNAKTLSLNLLHEIETPTEPVEAIDSLPPRGLPQTHSLPQESPGEALEGDREEWALIASGEPQKGT